MEGTSPQAPIDPIMGAQSIAYLTGLYGGKISPIINDQTTTKSALAREGVEAPEFHL